MSTWRIIFLVLLLFLASCNPYEGSPPAPTPTAVSAVTAAARSVPTMPRSPTPLPSCTVSTGIPAGALNLRTGAGMRYGVIRVLKEGEILEVLERAAWLEVIDAHGNQGYINSKFCK